MRVVSGDTLCPPLAVSKVTGLVAETSTMKTIRVHAYPVFVLHNVFLVSEECGNFPVHSVIVYTGHFHNP